MSKLEELQRALVAKQLELKTVIKGKYARPTDLEKKMKPINEAIARLQKEIEAAK